MADRFKSALQSKFGNKSNRKKKKLGIEISFVCSLRFCIPQFVVCAPHHIYSDLCRLLCRALVKKFMQSPASGFVEKSEYNMFWLSMHNDSADVDVYIQLLLSHLLSFMTNNSRIPFNAQVLLNTINFLVLRHPTTNPSTEVRHILPKWNKNRLKYNDQALPAAKDVLGVLYKQRHALSSNSLSLSLSHSVCDFAFCGFSVENQNGLSSLIIQCHQFYSHNEVPRIANYYENPTIIHVMDGLENIGRSSGDKVCIWPYLKELASRDPQNLRQIYEYVLCPYTICIHQLYPLSFCQTASHSPN